MEHMHPVVFRRLAAHPADTSRIGWQNCRKLQIERESGREGIIHLRCT